MKDNVNLYTYVGNSPVMYIDPSGLKGKPVGIWQQYKNSNYRLIGSKNIFDRFSGYEGNLLVEGVEGIPYAFDNFIFGIPLAGGGDENNKEEIKKENDAVFDYKQGMEKGGITLMIGGGAYVLKTELGSIGNTSSRTVNQLVKVQDFTVSPTNGVLEAPNFSVTPSGWMTKVPDFIVSPDGTIFPVPKGAIGPVPVVKNGVVNGSAFINGEGGANGQITTMRIMNPTEPKGGSPGYPNGYIKYENSAQPKPQGVDPYTGKTGDRPSTHFPTN